jgi:hypothetical protein
MHSSRELRSSSFEIAVAGRPAGLEELFEGCSRIVTCMAYSPAGRVADGDVRIAANPVTEGYVEAILDPETHLARLRAEDAGYADANGAMATEAAAAAATEPAEAADATEAAAAAAAATAATEAAEAG